MTKVQKDSENLDLDYVLSVLDVESLARETGFYKRCPKKITASSFVKGFWQMQQNGKNALRNWGVQIGSLIKDSVSKQSVDERLKQPGVDLCKALLKKALNTSLNKKWLSNQKKDLDGVLSLFNRILIQDSTIQQLPTELYEEFGGNHTKSGHRALMRIQALFEFKSESWLDFSADKYSQNDQSQAQWRFQNFEKKDLMIRDLGYFTLSALEELSKNQYFITSYKPNVNLFTLEGNPINLLKLLKEESQVDILVLVGQKKKLPMRLVANKLSEKQKQKKIKEAKAKAHASNNYSEDYFELLGYELFLTNIDESMLTAKTIAQLYGLRWYIEILFKSWKSYFNFKTIFEKSKMTYERTVISIYLVLIEFVYINNHVYRYINQQIKEKYQKKLSILKFMDMANDLFDEIINIKSIQDLDILLPNFAQNAVYEKRRNRTNMKEKYQYVNELKRNKCP